MFKAASKHIAKSAGSSTLHPVLDLNSSSRFRTLCLVKRKSSFWFWKKAKMIPTEVNLGDLFHKNLALPKPKTSVLLEKFLEMPTLSLDGSVGTQIATELNIEVKASDTLQMTIDLGDVIKTEMDWESVQETLRQNQINVDHVLFDEVRKSKRTTLCVVLGSLSTSGEGKLDEKTSATISTKDGGKIKKSMISVDIHTDGDVEKKVTHSFTIPPSTVLAYSSNEMTIDEGGFATLHSGYDLLDSDDEGLFKKADDNAQKPEHIVLKEFRALLKFEHYDRLKTEFKQLLETASDDLLSSLHLLLSSAEFELESKREEKNVKASTIEKLFENGPNPALKSILEILGFTIPTDFSNEDLMISFSEANIEVLRSVISLVDVLQDLDIGVRTLMSDITPGHVKILTNIALNELNNKENLVNTPVMKQLFYSDPSAQLILKNAGFVNMKVDEVDVLCFTKSKHLHLMDVYAFFYVFSF